ncbi:MAG: response regulator, partial [Lachnospiraceae bacterium]|nr:response regulator [Lachnospiraceae bacterium]
MTGALFGTALMLIAILRFDLLGTREIARDFAIDRISEGIIAVDNDGRIQYFNEPAARIYPEFRAFFSGKEGFGASSAEEDGEDAAEDGTKKRSFSRHNYTPYDILSFITDAVEKDEMLKVGDRIYSPEVNDLVFRGEQYGKLYALVDDTEHFRYMEELQKQRDIADKANAAKSKFLASMSHEIRTPINAVLGMDEMILRESSEKPIRAYASDIMSAGKTLLSLINDILDLSKIEEGKMEILPVQYDLSSLINDLVNMTRPRAVKKGLQFHVEAEEQVPHLLFGDEIRIRQCAMNILTNAVKYTEKGDVWLKISFEKEDDAHIQLRFSVKDTGIGMKKEDMEVLFSPYRRIEEKRNRAIEGTGLGMSITKQLLDLMDSSLEVESEYGKGSVFSFAVSQKVVKWEALGDYSDRFNGTEEQAGQYRELFHAPDARILVVDDTEMNLAVICSLLKKTCIVIDTAASGREALVMAEQTRYDLVFIDHMMPEMDGIETLQHMREGGACKEVPAIALTANAVSGAREMYLAAGFADYVSKPVDGERLEHLLADMLPAEKVLPPDSEISAAAENAADLSASDGVNVSAGAGAEPAGAGSDGLSPDRLMQNLQEIPEIDAAAGLKNCGDAEGYLNVLKVFHGTA